MSITKFAGARWWKFDFHTHTPASHDYGKGNQTLKATTPREWLLNFMSKEIDCVAVTDHNSGQWIDILKNELLSMRSQNVAGFRELHLFPGIEISVNGGVHLLAIFDEGKSGTDIATFLGSIGFTGTPGETDSCTSKSFEDVAEEIYKAKGIAIPAHVDKPNGLFEVQGKQGPTLTKNLKCKGLLAIEICNTSYAKPQIYQNLNLQLTEVLGSDSHDLTRVGTGFTWVKMEKPTFEALRLALHDGEDGVIRSDKTTKNPNHLENSFLLKQVEIKDGYKAGRGSPLIVGLSPWLTTLIGGRGSGKSSIFNYVRVALNRTEEMTKDGLADFGRFNSLGSREKSGMLTPNTEIKLTFLKDNRDVDLIWKNNQLTEVTYDENGIPSESTEIGDLNVRYPLKIFSQKQLFEMTKDSRSILHLVDSQLDKRGWFESLEQMAADWFGLRQEFRETARLLGSMNTYTKELEDINLKIKLFEDSGHKELFEKYNKASITKNQVQHISTNLTEFSNSLVSVLNETPKIQMPEFLDSTSSTKLTSTISKWNQTLQELTNISSQISTFGAEVDTSLDNTPWATNYQKTKEEYSALVVKLNAAGEKDVAGYEKLLKQKLDLAEKCNLKTKYEQRQIEFKKQLDSLLQEIKDHHKKLRELRNSVISEWNQGTAKDILKITLQPMADIEDAEKTLRDVIRKTDGEFAREILALKDDSQTFEGVISALINSNSIPWTFDEALEKRNGIIRSLFDRETVNKKLITHLDNLRQRTPEDMDRLAFWFPEDLIQLKIIKDHKPVEIESGSAGERTAAMLALLLSIKNFGPMLIDQPEDDLDTRLISELVVNGIRNIKHEQQLVIVTHNPNIPVNGAAEQIVELKYTNGQIQVGSSGGLQRTEVRSAVCEIMEGGKTALDRRYYRISQALRDSNNV